MSSPVQVHIVGAGIAGLVLARALLHRGIPSVLLDKSPDLQSSHRNSHGITLSPASYRRLLPILDLDDAAFRRTIAVDAGIGGAGRVRADDEVSASSPFRANRGKFEKLLAEGVAVRWEREVASVRVAGEADDDAAAAAAPSSLLPQRRLEMRFADGESWTGEGAAVLVVGADGPHSVVRRAVAPAADPEVLPFAVYNGRRKYGVDAFREKFGSAFENTNVREARHGAARLACGIDDRTPEEVRLSYTFSRPARQTEDDGLFRPQRAKSAAREIPEALFTEIQDLRETMDAEFLEIFDVEKVWNDRLLNWLMRRVNVDIDQLIRGAEKGLILIGDAVHAEPILGGQGANEAIEDGLNLAEIIASQGVDGVGEFYGSMHSRWAESHVRSKSEINSMHAERP